MPTLAREYYNMEARILAGTLSGLLGGVLMLVFAMVYTGLVSNEGALQMPNFIATITDFDLEYGLGPYTWLGLAVHLVFSAFLGGVWGALMPGIDHRSVLLLAGLFYGFVVYFSMYYIILPLVDFPFALGGRGFMMFTAHLVYGLGFMAYPRLIRGFYSRLHHR